jgi:hypothetical protein
LLTIKMYLLPLAERYALNFPHQTWALFLGPRTPMSIPKQVATGQWHPQDLAPMDWSVMTNIYKFTSNAGKETDPGRISKGLGWGCQGNGRMPG